MKGCTQHSFTKLKTVKIAVAPKLFNNVQIAEKSASLIHEVFIILCTSNLIIYILILLQ